MKQKFKFWVFVGDVTSGAGLALFGWSYLALVPNHKGSVRSSFQWKLG